MPQPSHMNDVMIICVISGLALAIGIPFFSKGRTIIGGLLCIVGIVLFVFAMMIVWRESGPFSVLINLLVICGVVLVLWKGCSKTEPAQEIIEQSEKVGALKQGTASTN